MSRILAVSLVALGLTWGSSVHAAETLAGAKGIMTKAIKADAKAHIAAAGITRATKIRVTYAPVRCGTKPISLQASCSILTQQTVWPTMTKQWRPTSTASFAGTLAVNGKVTSHRVGSWTAIRHLFRR